MILAQALLHARSTRKSVAVYDAAGKLVGVHDPTYEAERTWLRAIEADNPSYTFETTAFTPGEALKTTAGAAS